jgi:CheY-like chemotaxis protein
MKILNDLPLVPTLRILLLDDNPNGLCARKSVIEELGHYVEPYCNVIEALAAFQAARFDLVVTDYRMTQMHDGDLITHLRELQNGVPVILLSGLVDALGLNEKNTGADVVIAKSSNEVVHLTRAVNRLVKQQSPKKPARSQAAKRAVKIANK